VLIIGGHFLFGRDREDHGSIGIKKGHLKTERCSGMRSPDEGIPGRDAKGLRSRQIDLGKRRKGKLFASITLRGSL